MKKKTLSYDSWQMVAIFVILVLGLILSSGKVTLL